MDFTVNLGKITLKNPIITASGTFGYGVEFANFGSLEKLGAIVVKGLSLSPRKGNPGMRIAETPCGMLNSIGLENIGASAFIERVLPHLPWEKTPIIVNLYGETEEEFQKLASIFAKEERIAALEINISCPNVKEGGMLFGQNPDAAARVCEKVKKEARDKMVIIKLTPSAPHLKKVAQRVEMAGADAISLINTIPALAVDIYTRRPKLTNVIGGLSGPAIKPIAQKMVYDVVECVDIPVIGIGGIMSAEDVFEYILIGAHAVEIGSANLINPTISFNIAQDMEKVAERLGISSLEEYRGTLKV